MQVRVTFREDALAGTGCEVIDCWDAIDYPESVTIVGTVPTLNWDGTPTGWFQTLPERVISKSEIAEIVYSRG